ncbi:uncharacterized protein LOC127751817 [Frankliniella occidentalis]|uniref:Uncharacterized protein LOC127751817 n=1 Tax=Frankliniella occidentalis TaxID=133901 RepID=A0A9C6X9T9_FRAOC|nr:uncharacterized protein LOC127751817 [Frankliniella occidentalis]
MPVDVVPQANAVPGPANEPADEACVRVPTAPAPVFAPTARAPVAQAVWQIYQFLPPANPAPVVAMVMGHQQVPSPIQIVSVEVTITCKVPGNDSRSLMMYG